MKSLKFRNIKLISVLIFVAIGCKKVIDVSIKNSQPQIVITGEITNRSGPYQVKISKTINFSSDNIFPPVSGALVTISDDKIKDTLLERSPGIYETRKIAGKMGDTYRLSVSAEGKEYASVATMPQRVRIDSLSFLVGRKDALYPVVNFQDPAGVENYYQFLEFINGERLPDSRGSSVFSDRLSDGRYISRVLYDDSSDIKSGNVVMIQMNCITKPVFEYFNELYQISGSAGGFSSQAPSNPASNITGGALGYFSAHTISTTSVEIP